MVLWMVEQSVLTYNYIQTPCTSSHLEENICKISKRSVKNGRNCAHKAPMANVDGRSDTRTETRTPKSLMLKQVRQKVKSVIFFFFFFFFFFSKIVVIYGLKLAADDRCDKKFLLTSKLYLLGTVRLLP